MNTPSSQDPNSISADSFQAFIIQWYGDEFGYYGQAWDDFILSRGWIASSICNFTCSYTTKDPEVVRKTILAGIPASDLALKMSSFNAKVSESP